MLRREIGQPPVEPLGQVGSQLFETSVQKKEENISQHQIM
jgi:hypothetical protein